MKQNGMVGQRQLPRRGVPRGAWLAVGALALLSSSVLFGFQAEWAATNSGTASTRGAPREAAECAPRADDAARAAAAEARVARLEEELAAAKAAASASTDAPPPEAADDDDAAAVDAAVEARTRARLRNTTSQCGRVYFDILHDPVVERAVTHDECPDIWASIEAAGPVQPPLPPKAGPAYFRPLRLPNCRLRWYQPHEACDVIERQGNLVLAGDSLVRGIALALYMILTNNYRWGGVRPTGSDRVSAYSQCECDGTFGGDRVCHESTSMATQWAELSRAPQMAHVCPSWGGTAGRLHFIPIGAPKPWAFERLIANSGSGRATIYACEGFAWPPRNTPGVNDTAEPLNRLSRPAVNTRVWWPLLNMTRKYSHTRVIVGTILAKWGNHRTGSQSAESLAEYNGWLKHHVVEGHADLGLELFDGRQLVEGLFSRDDVHYGSHDNVALAQVLLNVLDRPPRRPRTAPAEVDTNPAVTWEHGPHRDLLWDSAGYVPGEEAVNELVDWVGPHHDLRGCRCWSGWRQMLKRNASASVCWCRDWCPPSVTPDFLSYSLYGTPNACPVGGAFKGPSPSAWCEYNCRQGNSAWDGRGCGAAFHRPCSRPVDVCGANCTRDVALSGSVPGCHPLCLPPQQ